MALSDQSLAEKRGISVEMVRVLRQTRGTSNESLEQLPEGALQRALRRLSYPDLARARHLHLLKRARGDDGQIPRNALARALAQLKANRPRTSRRLSVAGLPVAGSVMPLALVGAAAPAAAAEAGLEGANRWAWLGPGNIGGRPRPIVVHPLDPQRILAASAGRGVVFTANRRHPLGPVEALTA